MARCPDPDLGQLDDESLAPTPWRGTFRRDVDQGGNPARIHEVPRAILERRSPLNPSLTVALMNASSASHHALAARFVSFASRVHEVRELPDCNELTSALTEILRVVLQLAAGRTVDIFPAASAAKIDAIVTALLEHGPFTAPEELETLEAIQVSVDELFGGLANCANKAATGLRLI